MNDELLLLSKQIKKLSQNKEKFVASGIGLLKRLMDNYF